MINPRNSCCNNVRLNCSSDARERTTNNAEHVIVRNVRVVDRYRSRLITASILN